MKYLLVSAAVLAALLIGAAWLMSVYLLSLLVTLLYL